MADAPRAVNPHTAYERSDLSLGPIAWMALAAFVLIVIAPLVVLAGFSEVRGDANRALTQHPPPPRLEVNPPRALHAYLARQQQLLDTYGWIDRGRGIAREPIGQAMQQVLHDGIQGFPRASAAPAAPERP